MNPQNEIANEQINTKEIQQQFDKISGKKSSENFDFVNFIEKNPLIRLNGNYNNKFVPCSQT